MTSKIYNLFLLLVFFTLNKGFCTTIYHESFTIYNKGAVGVIGSKPVVDMDGVSWQLDFKECNLQNESDYLKTVSTSGGRLEAKDINGEAVWYSPWIKTKRYRNLQLSFIAKETGSGKNEKTKYLKLYITDANGNRYEVNSFMGNWGSFDGSVQIAETDSMQIEARICTHYSSDKVILDEVHLAGDRTIIGHDSDTEVASCYKEAKRIKANPADTVELFRLKVKDLASSDQLPTIPSQLFFSKTENSFKLDCFDTLFFMKGAEMIYPDSLIVNNENGVLFFLNQQLLIKSGTVEELAIRGVLKSQLNDGDSLQMVIDGDNHMWKTDTIGSGFASNFIADIYSNKIEVNVVGGSIDIVESPQWLRPDSVFIIAARLIDQFENVDMDSVGLFLQVNNAELIAPFEFSAGTYSWRYKCGEEAGLKLSVQSKDEKVKKSWEIPVFRMPEWVYAFDFEKENLQVDNWADFHRTDSIPLAGDFSLKHREESKSPSDLHFRFDKKYLFGEQFYWKVLLRNGNWSPSSANRFSYWLVTDNEELEYANGIALGVNLDDKSDRLQLWRMKEGKADSILMNSDFVWGKKTMAELEVSFEKDNRWKLLIKSGSDTWTTTSVVQKSDVFPFDYGGFQYFFTASRAGEFWLDNLELVTDNRKPELSAISIPEHGKLILSFTEPVSMANNGIEILNEDGEILKHQIVSIDKNRVELTFDVRNSFLFQLRLKEYSDLKNLKGQIKEEWFESYAVPEKGEIVFNEIMFEPADGNPEFIEIRNTSNRYFELNDLYLKKESDVEEANSGKGLVNFKDRIAPGEIIALTTDSLALVNSNLEGCFEQFRTSNIPTLVNSGMTLYLGNKRGKSVDELSYSPKQHHPFLKETKGVSLERSEKDGQAYWYSAAQDVGFSTPGCGNSQNEAIVDNICMELEPEVITPNGDGENDHVELKYDLPQAGFLIQAEIYNSNGFVIDHWLNNQLLGTNGALIWKTDGKRVAPGFYVMIIELLHPEGSVYRAKKSFAVSASKN
ncbi:lamin tail domain-containing protein [Prolixibacteraceae bacterium JC049]|nr:lamin tail domain-containing protein [Prolixibacteraceae bacterium JC049]